MLTDQHNSGLLYMYTVILSDVLNIIIIIIIIIITIINIIIITILNITIIINNYF